MREKRSKISAKDFLPIKIIGRGAFGEVRLCRTKENEYVAIKKLKKSEMIFKNQIKHLKTEKKVLFQACEEWIPKMYCSFKDNKYLYLVMEYLPGGDLMNFFIQRDILPEEEAKFYIAQLVIAINSIHKMNFIHRDIKPDNILIDKNGHIKLSDFGLCAEYNIQPKIDYFRKFGIGRKGTKCDKFSRKKRRSLLYSTVGTPDYIAPEIFSQSGYD